jgi:hypothetical protein
MLSVIGIFFDREKGGNTANEFITAINPSVSDANITELPLTKLLSSLKKEHVFNY